MKTYSIDEVREIVLEYENTAFYAHSHKLTRFELKDQFSSIWNKWKLNY